MLAVNCWWQNIRHDPRRQVRVGGSIEVVHQIRLAPESEQQINQGETRVYRNLVIPRPRNVNRWRLKLEA